MIAHIAIITAAKPNTANRTTRFSPYFSVSQPLICDTPKNDTALTEKNRLYCDGDMP